MKNQGIVYRCPRFCPIHKHCFVVKLAREPKQPVVVLKKCEPLKKDLEIEIGMIGTGDRER